MGEAIRGLNEIFGRDMEEERRQVLREGNLGLGPPDLILIVKEVNGMEKKYYHLTYGIAHHSQDDFANYFKSLKQLQIPLQKPLFIVKYGFCFTYDSISHQDFCIPSYSCKFNSPQNWKNLHISSVMRFYRHDNSLLYAIFGGLPFNYSLSVTLSLFEVTMEEIEYAAEIFSMLTLTNEHQLALARALLCRNDTRQITKFLHNYSNRLPNVLVHIAKILPPFTAIEAGLYFLIESHLDLYSDDLESVFVICTHYLATGEVDKCKRFVSLLMQTQTEHPQSAICLARICIAEKHYKEAFSFLNISALSKGWQMPGLALSEDQNFIIAGNPYPTFYSDLEKQIVHNPVTGRTQAFFEATNELIVAMGTKDFLNLASEFSQSHASYTEKEDFPEHPFYYSDSCRSKEEFYLFDPGVQNDASISCDLDSLPYSLRFQQMIKRVMDGHARITRLSSGLKNKYKASDLVLSIRLRDGVVAKSAFEYMKANNKLTGTCLMLMLRAALLGIVTIDLNTLPSNLTADQASVLPFVRGLVQRIMQLERVYS